LSVQPQLQGKVDVSKFDGAKIHVYEAPLDSILVHSFIVEGPTKLVLFDSQLLLPFAAELADYIESIGKPLDRIIVSHAHPDHWSGLYRMHPRFPDAQIYAFKDIIAYMKANGDEILRQRRAKTALGPNLAPEATLPTATLEPGSQVIDSVTYDFQALENGESEHQTVVRLPDLGVLMVFDLVGSKSEHMFIVLPTFNPWIGALEALKAQQFSTLLAGHGLPVQRSDIDATIEYLRTAKELYHQHSEPSPFAEAMIAAFPDRDHGEWIQFAALMLYKVIDP
jgi:glyoxylase-like metal-dependent hydrolase (beta-lactamase superfamily II)